MAVIELARHGHTYKHAKEPEHEPDEVKAVHKGPVYCYLSSVESFFLHTSY